MKYDTILLLFGLSVLLGMIVGCGTGQVPLTGRITYEDDGAPVEFGIVVLTTPTFQAKGDINKDGTFTIGSYTSTDGLPPGKYQVAISGTFIDADASGLKTYGLLHPKWSSPATSGYEIDVQKGTKLIEIKVERNPEPRPKGI